MTKETDALIRVPCVNSILDLSLASYISSCWTESISDRKSLKLLSDILLLLAKRTHVFHWEIYLEQHIGRFGALVALERGKQDLASSGRWLLLEFHRTEYDGIEDNSVGVLLTHDEAWNPRGSGFSFVLILQTGNIK